MSSSREEEHRFRKLLSEYDQKGNSVWKLDDIALEAWMLATRIQNLSIEACNRELSIKEMNEEEAAEEKIKYLMGLVNSEIRVTFDGDPRGYVVKVLFPKRDVGGGHMERPYNTWGGSESGFGIGGRW